MKETFITKNFSQGSLEIITHARIIIDDYEQQGYNLTLRQLYYQFVARGLIENTQRSYKRIGSIINDGRLAGLIDWDAIEDRTRNLQGNAHWDSPAQRIEYASRAYQINKWEGQDFRVEVWVEKEALIGVVESACRELDIDYFACRGYVSQSELYLAGKRAKRRIDMGIIPVILHLGDHDPSGIDMTRDNTERMVTFADPNVVVERIALNMDQVEQYSPPPNPAKMTDSRFKKYREDYGSESWELDALEPSVIKDLIVTNTLRYRDEDTWDERVDQQDMEVGELQTLANNWNEVSQFLSELGE